MTIRQKIGLAYSALAFAMIISGIYFLLDYQLDMSVLCGFVYVLSLFKVGEMKQ